MLKQRVITALALLAILLPALFYPSAWPFATVALVLIAAAAWEWGRLNAAGPMRSGLMGVACGLACGLAWYAGWLTQPFPWLWGLTGAAWVLGGSYLLATGVPGWPKLPEPARWVIGWVALCLAWLAVAQARVIGINFLLSALVLVWVADIAAYFAGKAFGTRFFRRKLAPSISPGKSWEGALGGMLGVLILGVVWTQVEAAFGVAPAERSVYGQLAARHGFAVMLAGLVFLSAMSVVGDLVESLVKRSAGVKDSSALLPGHGGVLDRIDALLPVLPLAMMLVNYSR
jgi:phosphatidate cytidylyltransferase